MHYYPAAWLLASAHVLLSSPRVRRDVASLCLAAKARGGMYQREEFERLLRPVLRAADKFSDMHRGAWYTRWHMNNIHNAIRRAGLWELI
jgi:hypothetical protein